MTPLLQITDLHVNIEGSNILRGISLTVNNGETHAIMGPNGSCKSTLVNTLMGHPKFEVTKGSVEWKGKDLFKMSTDERARAGLFLAFQYPKEISGVTLRSLLFAAYKVCRASSTAGAACHAERNEPKASGDEAHAAPASAQRDTLQSPIKFKKHLEDVMQELHMNPEFAERSVNEGFSGGEKKKAEILQLKILKPHLALLDETDSGLDVDALKIVSEGVNSMKSPTFSSIIVTHYARILEYLTPDRVHVMVGGKIVESGGAELAERLEKEGYSERSQIPLKAG